MPKKGDNVNSGDARLAEDIGEQTITKQTRQQAFALDDAKRCKCHKLLPGYCPTKWMSK
jgi:hypothetical protein